MIVATAPDPVAVAAQLAKPVPKVTDGVAGTAKPDEKVTVTVSPARRPPVDVVLKLTVQFECANATSEVETTVTFVGVPAAAIVTAAAFVAVESALVLIVSVDEPVVLVFVIP